MVSTGCVHNFFVQKVTKCLSYKNIYTQPNFNFNIDTKNKHGCFIAIYKNLIALKDILFSTSGSKKKKIAELKRFLLIIHFPASNP